MKIAKPLAHRQPTILDLFSGAGGIALGFQQAGFRVVGGVDFSKQAIGSFNANLPGAQGVVRDLRDSDFSDIEDLVGGGVDVIVGGPSCQGFSTSGGLSKGSGRDEADPRNRLFVNYINIVDLLQPSWIVFENVPGLLLYDNGRVALDIVRAFKEIGYRVAPMILLAADFGVPQLRRRLVFVGNRTGSEICFPAATHGNPDLWKNFSLPFAHLSRIGHGKEGEVFGHVSFADACDDLPAVDEGGCVDGAAYGAPARTEYQRMIRGGSTLVRQHEAAELSKLDGIAARTLQQGQNWRDLPAEVLPPRFSKIRRYDATTLLRRLRADHPAYTITTKFNEATTGAFIHPTQARTLTLREAARLQAFPDDFIFEGTASQIRQQIGNAVPPLLARCVAEAIKPAIMRDVFGASVAHERAVLTIDADLDDRDPLRLHGARRKTQDARQLAFG
jgi:DNA (cytosine-5)-methyltransferase 1